MIHKHVAINKVVTKQTYSPDQPRLSHLENLAMKVVLVNYTYAYVITSTNPDVTPQLG